MYVTMRKLYGILDPEQRSLSLVLLAIFLTRGLLDTAGIASIMPFLAVVGNPDIIQTNPFLASLHVFFGQPEQQKFLVILGAIVLTFLTSSLLFSAYAHWYMQQFAQMTGYQLSTRLMSTYLQRPYSWFLRQNSANLGRTILQEVDQVLARSLLPVLRLISRLVVTGFIVFLVFLIEPLIALIAASLLVSLYTLIYLFIRRYLARISSATWLANEARFRISNEAFGGIKDVKVTGLEHAYIDRYRRPALENARNLTNQNTLSVVPKYFMELTAFGSMLLLLVFLIITRHGDLGAALPIVGLYAFAGYRLLPALQDIYHALADLRFGTRPLDYLYGQLSSSEMPTPIAATRQPNEHATPLVVSASVDLQSIQYHYPDAPAPSLVDVSLRIPANYSVAFVGTTGAGKTTLIDIIMGLLRPDFGKLLVDGTEITSENVRRWQANIGYVPQNIFLSDASIAENIAFGIPLHEIDSDAIERAARMASLHEFVINELPDGYETQIGERGVRLSGGQRQRIGIARALYRNPGVLVLDEATSALDNVTERAVIDAISQLGNSKTIIMIAHRLSTVRHCDMIFLMERGRLVASGTYDELSAGSTTFREMAASVG
jgi:ABC-type multidrug transport system fused ATPase/permease subunit